MLGKNDNVKDLNLIGTGTTVEGKIKSQGSIRVDGKLIGELVVSENAFLGESGQVEGTVNARNITIGGKVQGEIIAAEKLVFESKANVKGEIKAAKLVIEEGAVFDGTSVMTNEKPQQQKKPEQKT